MDDCRPCNRIAPYEYVPCWTTATLAKWEDIFLSCDISWDSVGSSSHDLMSRDLQMLLFWLVIAATNQRTMRPESVQSGPSICWSLQLCLYGYWPLSSDGTFEWNNILLSCSANNPTYAPGVFSEAIQQPYYYEEQNFPCVAWMIRFLREWIHVITVYLYPPL